MKTIKHVKSARMLRTLFCTMLLTILCALPAWAGTWVPTEYNGYQYKNEDGTYLTATWLRDNGKWYFFDEQGLLVVNSVVEGYQLGADGAEVTGAAEITSQYAQVIIPVTATTTEPIAAVAESAATTAKTAASETTAAQTTTLTYVLNKNTRKFHKPSCSSVSDMAAKNRMDSGSGRDEVIAQGYVPCKRCNP